LSTADQQIAGWLMTSATRSTASTASDSPPVDLEPEGERGALNLTEDLKLEG